MKGAWDHIVDGLLVMTGLVLASLVGNLLADQIEGKIAHRIAVELRSITQ
jgi:hypothetical protein